MHPYCGRATLVLFCRPFTDGAVAAFIFNAFRCLSSSFVAAFRRGSAVAITAFHHISSPPFAVLLPLRSLPSTAFLDFTAFRRTSLHASLPFRNAQVFVGRSLTKHLRSLPLTASHHLSSPPFTVVLLLRLQR